MARFSPMAVAAIAALGYANGFVIKSTMPSMKPLQMVCVIQEEKLRYILVKIVSVVYLFHFA